MKKYSVILSAICVIVLASFNSIHSLGRNLKDNVKISIASKKVGTTPKVNFILVGSYSCQCTPFRRIYVWVTTPGNTSIAYVSLTSSQSNLVKATGSYNQPANTVSNCTSSSPSTTCACSYTGTLN